MNKYIASKVIPHPSSQVLPFGKALNPHLSELAELPNKVSLSAKWLDNALNPIPFQPSKIDWEIADYFMAEMEGRFNKLRAYYAAYRQSAKDGAK